MQPFHNWTLTQVKFEENIGPTCGDCEERRVFANWGFIRKGKFVGQGTSKSDKLMGKSEKVFVIIAPSKKISYLKKRALPGD